VLTSSAVAAAVLAPSLSFAHDEAKGPIREDAPPAAVKAEPHRPPEPPPPPATSGTTLIITGSVFAGVGALDILAAPICTAISADDRGLCFGLTGGAGGVSLGLGVAILAAGLIDRDLTEKRERLTVGLDVDASGGGAFVLGGSF
jgi:hypothetical protein